MKRWLGLGLGLLWIGSVSAAGLAMYPGAKLDIKETKKYQTIKAKSSPGMQKKMGKQTFYVTQDSFKQVYDYFHGKYPETDLNIKKISAPLAKGAELNDAYFCLDQAASVSRSRYWLKIQRPMIKLTGPKDRPGAGNIRDVTVITVVEK